MSLMITRYVTGDEAAKCKNCLSARVRSAGYELVEDRGDYIGADRSSRFMINIGY